MIFEPTMIFIACLCMTVLHPSFVFGNVWAEIELAMKGQGKSQQKPALGKDSPSSQSMSYEVREYPDENYGPRA